MGAAKVRSWANRLQTHALFNPQNYQQRFYGLALASGSCTLLTGHPSSAPPDTDGRHDRTGHGTWMLLAVFVARDDRPWLSVTGTCASGFGLVVSGMDPRACDGWTTVCPLWLLGAASPDSTLSIAGYRLAPSNFVTANCSASTPSRQRTLSITISLPPGPLPYAYY